MYGESETVPRSIDSPCVPTSSDSVPRPTRRSRSIVSNRSSEVVYPSANIVAARVVPKMWGTSKLLSRITVTSRVGWYTRATSSGFTPNDASL